jgi:carbamoyltransferase
MTRYVGCYSEFYDAAITIINEDGTVEFASQAERFSGKKNDPIIPESLWAYTNDNDHLSFYENVGWKEKYRSNLRQDSKAILENNLVRDGVVPMYDSLVYDDCHSHHMSHAAGAFYTRPWKDRDTTVQVSIDGCGEYQCVMVYDNKFNVLHEQHYPKSVGLIYTDTTKSLGLNPLEDEYVVMGLSSYGTPVDDIVKWLQWWWNSVSDINPDIALEKKLEEPNTYGYRKRIELMDYLDNVCQSGRYRREDIASSVQKFTEWAIMGIMNIARKHGNKLVYSGGCAQNIVINTRLPDLFDEVHVSISPTDAGSSLGTAAMSWEKATGKDQLVWTPYLGYNIDREVNPKEVVDHLLDKKICGLANGRAEFGPRALGNRSLIADVRYDVKETVNNIKRRQQYRPFAPAILEEYAEEYFEGHMGEYMQYTCKAKHDYKSVTHVDGSARVQIVKKDCQSIFRKVIEEYYERTGVPMLLNTSLNIRGRPMVNDIHDARLWEQKYKVKVF